MKGYFRVMRDDASGIRYLTHELSRRGIPANINVTDKSVQDEGELCDVLREAASLGFELGSAWGTPVWGMSYDEQKRAMETMCVGIFRLSGQPMRIFSSKYSAYDETTLRLADELKIPYIFGRGTSGASATVYQPEGFQVKIISTSDVVCGGRTGSLADGSFWARGATAKEFQKALLELNEDRITLAVQSQLGGRKLHWWRAVEALLDTNKVSWCSIDEFAAELKRCPFRDIPVNQDVSYENPMPLCSLEDEPEL